MAAEYLLHLVMMFFGQVFSLEILKEKVIRHQFTSADF